ncbi:MAG: MraY family glycosyltransferase [Patescibacteria group bacterium]
MTTAQIIALSVSLAAAGGITPVVMAVARRWSVVDDPAQAPDRKLHRRPVPLLGGLAIIAATWITWFVLSKMGALISGELPVKYLVGLTAAGALIAIGGALDDRFRLPAKRQIGWVVMAAGVAIATGIGVQFITNPFGGFLDLTGVRLTLFTWRGEPYHLTLWADLFTFLWLMGATYTTKILDGLDGLVSGLGVIGSLIIFLLTLRPEVSQTGVGLLALSLTGASTGFLIWNWHPAKVFLGESGSLYIGFLLGVLSIISGGKIATALLILGLPILDLLWVIVQRLRAGKSPFASADRLHLHFRLLDAGLSTRQSVLLIYLLVALFGLSTLYVRGVQKLEVLGGLLVVMALLVWWVMHRSSRRRPDSISQ